MIMKRIIAIFIIAVLIAPALAGCVSEKKPVTVELKNATEYENDEKSDVVYSDENTSWEGTYMNADETKSLHIVNFDGTSFQFEFASTDALDLAGVTTVDGDMAYYMDLIFAISIQGGDISVWIDEPQDDSHEREMFKDTYFRSDIIIINPPKLF